MHEDKKDLETCEVSQFDLYLSEAKNYLKSEVERYIKTCTEFSRTEILEKTYPKYKGKLPGVLLRDHLSSILSSHINNEVLMRDKTERGKYIVLKNIILQKNPNISAKSISYKMELEFYFIDIEIRLRKMLQKTKIFTKQSLLEVLPNYDITLATINSIVDKIVGVYVKNKIIEKENKKSREYNILTTDFEQVLYYTGKSLN